MRKMNQLLMSELKKLKMGKKEKIEKMNLSLMNLRSINQEITDINKSIHEEPLQMSKMENSKLKTPNKDLHEENLQLKNEIIKLRVQ